MKRANGFYFFKSTLEFILLFVEVNMPISAFFDEYYYFSAFQEYNINHLKRKGGGMRSIFGWGGRRGRRAIRS